MITELLTPLLFWVVHKEAPEFITKLQNFTIKVADLKILQVSEILLRYPISLGTLVQPFNISIILLIAAPQVSLCSKALFIHRTPDYTSPFDNQSSIKQNALLRGEEPGQLEPRVNIHITWEPLGTVEHIQQSIIIAHCP